MNYLDSGRTKVIEHPYGCLKNQLDILLKAPVFNILCIQADDLLEIRDTAAAAHLPQARETMYDTKTALVVRAVAIIFENSRRACSHQRHITF